MSTENWKLFYDRWSNRFSKIDNKTKVIDKITKKYGYTQPILNVMLFDCLYEYAVRNGVQLETNDDCEFITVEYSVDGYNIALCATHQPFIFIRKQ